MTGTQNAPTRSACMHDAAPMLSLFIPGRPVPWSRAGSNGGVRYTPKVQAAYMRAVGTMARAAMAKAGYAPFEGAVEVMYRATYAWPKTWTERDRQTNGCFKSSRGDLDNLVKEFLDSLNAIAYRDDAQVAKLDAQKVYGLIEGVTIMISPLSQAEAA